MGVFFCNIGIQDCLRRVARNGGSNRLWRVQSCDLYNKSELVDLNRLFLY